MHTEPEKSNFRQTLGSRQHFNKIGKRYVYQTVCISIFIVILATVFLNKNKDFAHILTDVQFKICQPLSYMQDKINTIKDVLDSDYLTNLQQLQQENIVLKHTVASLIQSLSELKDIKNLTDKISTKQKCIPAKVANVVINQCVAKIVLNCGQNSGILKDDFVVNENGLVGRIVDVGDDWSVAILTIDANFQLPIRFKSIDKMAIAKGGGYDHMLTSVKNGNFAIQANDDVVTSGYGGLYIEGIFVGKALQDGKILPCYDVNKLRIVCVIGHLPF